MKTALHGLLARGDNLGGISNAQRTSLAGYDIGHNTPNNGSGGGIVAWGDLQTTLAQNNAGTLVANNIIDQAVTEMRAWNTNSGIHAGDNPTLKQQYLKLRIAGGIGSPAFAMELGGAHVTPCYDNPSVPGPPGVPLPRFWSDAHAVAYYKFEAALVAAYDNTPEIAQVNLARCMTIYTEPMIRQQSNRDQVSAMIAAGYNAENKTGTTNCPRQVYDAVVTLGSATVTSATAAFKTGTGDVNHPICCPGFPPGTTLISRTSATVAVMSNPATMNVAAATLTIFGTAAQSDQQQQLDDISRRSVWLNTRVGYAISPYQILDGGTNPSDVNFSIMAARHAVAMLGRQFSCENNSMRLSYLSGTGDYQTMYAAFGARSDGGVNGIQTATLARISNSCSNTPTGVQCDTDLTACIQSSGTDVGAGHVELPNQFQGTLTAAEIASLGAALPVPAATTSGGAILQRIPFASSATGTTYVVPNAATTAGSTLVLVFSSRAATAQSVTSIGSGTWAVRRTQIADNTFSGLWCYDVVNAGAFGASAFTITVGVTGSIEGTFYELAAMGTTPFESGATAAANTALPSVTYPTTAANDIVLGAIAFASNSTLTVPPAPAWTLDAIQQGLATGVVSTIQTGSQILAATGTQTFNATISASTHWMAAIVAYTVPAGSGVPTPGVPTGVQATATGTSGQITVSWTAGSGTATSYTIKPRLSSDQGATWTDQSTQAPGLTNPFTCTGLTNGTGSPPSPVYDFKVLATNASASPTSSAYSTGSNNAVAFTSATGPSQIAQPLIQFVGDGEVIVTWNAPVPGTQPITSYTLTPQIVGGAALPPVVISDGPPPTSQADLTGLQDGVALTFTVTAHTSVGDSTPSVPSASATPVGVPATPVAPAVSSGDATLTVVITSPSDHGSAITSYTFNCYLNGVLVQTQTQTDVTFTFSGLTNNGQPYNCTAIATNGIGDSLESVGTLGIPVGMPGAVFVSTYTPHPAVVLPTRVPPVFRLYDYLTLAPRGVLRLESVTYDCALNGAGGFQGSLPISLALPQPGDDAATTRKRLAVQAQVSAIDEGRTALIVDNDGVITWSGLLWTTLYTSDTEAIQINGSEDWSWWAHRVITADLPIGSTPGTGYVAQDQLFVVNDIMAWAQGVATGNASIVLPTTPTSGVTVDLNVRYYERQVIHDVIGQLAAGDTGFDFRIVGEYASGAPVRRLLLGYPHLGATQAQSSLLWQFPGNIIKYTYAKDGTQAADVVYGQGSGTAGQALLATATNAAMLGGGWPLLEDVAAFKDQTTQAALQRLTNARRDLASSVPDNTAPAIMMVTVDADSQPRLGSYGPGDNARFRILDPRFPGQLDVWKRVVAYSVQVPPANTEEPTKVVLTLAAAT